MLLMSLLPSLAAESEGTRKGVCVGMIRLRPPLNGVRERNLGGSQGLGLQTRGNNLGLKKNPLHLKATTSRHRSLYQGCH